MSDRETAERIALESFGEGWPTLRELLAEKILDALTAKGSEVERLRAQRDAAVHGLNNPRAMMEQVDAVAAICKERDAATAALGELWLVCENGDLIGEDHPVRDVVIDALNAAQKRGGESK